MFKPNEMVSHPGYGACTVLEICEQDFSGESCQYYKLCPMVDKAAVVYVPVDNAEKIGLRTLISETQADTLLASLTQNEATWISDANEKQKRYRSLFSTNGVQALYDSMVALSVIVRQSTQKALGNADKEMLRKIQNKTISEIAAVKGIPMQEALQQVEDIILNEPAS